MLFLYLIVLFSLFGLEKFININKVHIYLKIAILFSLTSASLFCTILTQYQIFLVFVTSYILCMMFYVYGFSYLKDGFEI